MSRSRPGDVLRDHPLPRHDVDTDKDSRGRILVIAGSDRTPGAAVLAGTAALRVGAGKLQIATAPPNRTPLGVHVPEALSVSFDDKPGLARMIAKANAVTVGAGLLDDDADLAHLAAATIVADSPATVLVIDAGSLGRLPRVLPPRTVLMPNVSEARQLLGIEEQGAAAATEAARRYNAVVTVRGAETWTADPDGHVSCDDRGNVGLAVSGSGDVLSGMVGGLAARGADPLTAVLWAVHVHGVAGERLADRIAPLGYLAREMLDVVPGLLHELGDTYR
jgi:hydroxyethylthiazole kinase-like uncharacterized protein yjeF